MAQTNVLTRTKDNPRAGNARWRRIDRLLVAAIVAAVALSGAVIWRATSQGGSVGHKATHAKASSSTSPDINARPKIPESAFASQPAFTGAAVTKYGQASLQKAYRQLVNFAFDTGWDPALMAKRKSALTKSDFAAVRLSLTASCAKAYDLNVTKTLASDKTAIRDLEGSMFFAIGGIDATTPASGVPTVSNRMFTRAKFTVDKSHGQRLSMSFTAKATVHMHDKAGKLYFVQTARALQYLLVPNGGTDASVRPFLIDAWASRMQSQAPQPA